MGSGLILGRAPTKAECQDFAARAAAPSVNAVATTGMFCRSGCPARTLLRRNPCLFKTTEAAIAASFRPAKRCRTDKSRAGRP